MNNDDYKTLVMMFPNIAPNGIKATLAANPNLDDAIDALLAIGTPDTEAPQHQAAILASVQSDGSAPLEAVQVQPRPRPPSTVASVPASANPTASAAVPLEPPTTPLLLPFPAHFLAPNSSDAPLSTQTGRDALLAQLLQSDEFQRQLQDDDEYQRALVADREARRGGHRTHRHPQSANNAEESTVRSKLSEMGEATRRRFGALVARFSRQRATQQGYNTVGQDGDEMVLRGGEDDNDALDDDTDGILASQPVEVNALSSLRGSRSPSSSNRKKSTLQFHELEETV